MTISVKRNWLLGGYEAQFIQTVTINPVTLSKVCHELLGVLKDSLPEGTSPRELVNLKGRDKLEPTLAALPPAYEGELLTVGGEIATASESGSFVWAPFRFSCVTNFVRFEGSNKIVYSPEMLSSETVPDWFPWWLLGAAAPLRIDYLRLAFENFTSRFKVAQFGLTPVVSDTLRIDATNDSLHISLTTQQPRWNPCNPLETLPLFKRVAVVLDIVCACPLSTQFSSELSLALNR